MIKSFRNKNLEKFFYEGESISDVNNNRLRLILSQLDAADELKDCKIPSLKFTRLKKSGVYSISVGNGKKLVFKLTPRKQES